MNWHTTTVPAAGLDALMGRILDVGGVVACSTPSADGVRVVWICPSGRRSTEAFEA